MRPEQNQVLHRFFLFPFFLVVIPLLLGRWAAGPDAFLMIVMSPLHEMRADFRRFFSAGRISAGRAWIGLETLHKNV